MPRDGGGEAGAQGAVGAAVGLHGTVAVAAAIRGAISRSRATRPGVMRDGGGEGGAQGAVTKCWLHSIVGGVPRLGEYLETGHESISSKAVVWPQRKIKT